MTNANLDRGVIKPDLEFDSTNNWNLAKLGFTLILDLNNFAQESIQGFILPILLLQSIP